jgi:hypothetical protein
VKYPEEVAMFETRDGDFEVRPLCSDAGFIPDFPLERRLLIRAESRDFIDPSLYWKYPEAKPLTRAARELVRWSRQ